jgi:hypothetical protein
MIPIRQEGGMQTTATVTRADVRREFGDLDDITVASILDTGASLADLVEARTRLTDDGLLGRPPSPTVSRIALLVRDALDRGETEDDVPDEPDA